MPNNLLEMGEWPRLPRIRRPRLALSVVPDPLCGAEHPFRPVTCTREPGHRERPGNAARAHHSSQGGVTTVWGFE